MKVERWREIVEVSRGLDPYLQDPLRYRARTLALEVALSLVGARGELLFEGIEANLAQSQGLSSGVEEDHLLFVHLLNCLKKLREDATLQNLLNRFSPPLCHRGAEQFVRDTLWPFKVEKIGIREIKASVLAVWFTWLRQITGSCFATAPAILVQAQHPHLLFQDLLDLLSKGGLSRVVEGRLYTVPLCPSHEFADLYRPLGNSSLEYSVAMQAAFQEAQVAMPVKEIEAKSPVEWIEKAVAEAIGLKLGELKDEKQVQRDSMDLLLAKQSAVYYRAPNEKEKKGTLWLEKTAQIRTVYQAFGECALLRAWEYTLASFCDAKIDFAHWNLYVSLGLHPEQPGGVGAFLHKEVTAKLSDLQKEQQTLQEEYERSRRLAHTLEIMFQQTSNSERRHSLRAEWTRAELSANGALQRFHELEEEAQEAANLFSAFIQAYDAAIPNSFQEIYDPALVLQSISDQNDSPAGFRLCFKSGYNSLWNFIRNKEEFITALRTFFTSVEREIQGDASKVESFSTSLIQYVQTEEFLEGASARAAHNRAFERRASKPWEYVSGGNLQSLMAAYSGRAAPFTVFERRIQNEQELLLFLEQAGKEVGVEEPLLIHSPTHAFIYRPDWVPRDLSSSLKAMEGFWSGIKIEDERSLVEKFAERLAPEERLLFLHQSRLEGPLDSIEKWRSILPGKVLLIDSFLYESLPQIPIEKARRIAHSFSVRNLSEKSPFLTPLQLRVLLKEQLPSTIDGDRIIAETLRQEGLASPAPILFGDSNGSAGFLGLAISPHGVLELWCFHRTSMRGFPMRTWFEQQRGGVWTILSKKEEYFVREMKF